MERKVGRPCATPIMALEQTLAKFKNRLFHKGKAVSKRNEVWEEISQVLLQDPLTIRKSAAALYTYVTCNKNGILNVLQEGPLDQSLDTQPDSSLTKVSLDLTGDSNDQNHAVRFDFHVQGKEFDKLLVTRVIKDASKKCGTRTRTRLSKGKSKFFIYILSIDPTCEVVFNLTFLFM